MKKNLLIVASGILAMATLSGCGGGGGSSSGSPVETQGITVERGPVKGATVTDANNKIGVQLGTTNVYYIPKPVTYPVTVTGGWVDVNNDNVKDAGDIVLDKVMKSYSAIVTPVSSAIVDPDPAKRLAMWNKLALLHDTTVINLQKLPSQGDVKAIALHNAIFKESYDNNISMGALFTFDTLNDPTDTKVISLKNEYDTIKAWGSSSNGMVNGVVSASKMESYLISQNSGMFETAQDSSSSPVQSTISHNGFIYRTVTSPTTGKVWLDRNLGASEVCGEVVSDACLGGQYQWGRPTDGHELRNSTVSDGAVVNASDISGTTLTTLYGSSFLEGYKYGETIWLGEIQDVNDTVGEASGWLYKDTLNNVWRDNSVGDFGDWNSANYEKSFHDGSAFWKDSTGAGICPSGYAVASWNELFNERMSADFLKLNAGMPRFELPGNEYGLNWNMVAYWTSDIYFVKVDGSRILSFRMDTIGKSVEDTTGNTPTAGYANKQFHVNYVGYGLPVRCVKQ